VISPVEESRLKPVGKAGEIVQVVGDPLTTVGNSGARLIDSVRLSEVAGSVKFSTGLFVTVSERVVVADPVEFVAVRVNGVAAMLLPRAGVPEIVPVTVSSVKPEGKEGEMLHVMFFPA
jgi:hypothetical protein